MAGAASSGDGSPNSSSGPWIRSLSLFCFISFIFMVLGIEPRVSGMLGRHFVSWAWRAGGREQG